MLTREQLAHAIFPLGDATKAEVRAEAARRGLAVADKPDSHDICFIADGDTRGFLADRLGRGAGRRSWTPTGQWSASTTGRTRSRSASAAGCASAAVPTGSRRYVLSISPVSNTVRVGPREALKVDRIVGERPVWSGCEPPEEWTPFLVQLRAHGEVYSCRARQYEGRVEILLDEPALGVAKGQAAVLYDGDVVMGSSTIAETSRVEQAAANQRRMSGAKVLKVLFVRLCRFKLGKA